MAMGLFQILKEAFTAVPTFDDLNDEFYDGLEEALILADVGADTACDIVEQLRKRVKEKFIGRMEDVKDALRDILRSKLDVGDSALTLRGKPAVVLVIGVNGVGKTTSIGKLAARLKGEGKKVLLCAGDRTREPIPVPCCSTRCRPPRRVMRTWCSATRRGGSTTSRIL